MKEYRIINKTTENGFQCDFICMVDGNRHYEHEKSFTKAHDDKDHQKTVDEYAASLENMGYTRTISAAENDMNGMN